MAVEGRQEEVVDEIVEKQVPPAAAKIPYDQKFWVLIASQPLRFGRVIAAAESRVFLAYPSQLVRRIVPL